MGIQRLHSILKKHKITPYHLVNMWRNLMCRLTQRSWRIIKNYTDTPVTYRTRSSIWSQTTGIYFVSMDSADLSGDSHSILTHVTTPYLLQNTQVWPSWVWGYTKAGKTAEKNGVVKEDNGPWIALVVLAAKPHQENVPYNAYQWRLCVSYQKMNQVTCPLNFTITRCDDAVQEIDT